MRLTRGERIFDEECFIKANQLAHPGVSEDRLLDLDIVNGFRIASESKLLKEFRREEEAMHRSRRTRGSSGRPRPLPRS